MTSGTPAILSGLSDLCGRYDTLICDVWGVLHNGVRAFAPAVDALQRFRAAGGKVVLLSNAPRPPQCIVPQLRGFGVVDACYDDIVTSGGSARAEIARRAPLKLLHLGPDRDTAVFDGLDVTVAGPDSAELAVCTGLFDDDNETPEDYRDIFGKMRARDLEMLCANPDLVVQRGDKLVFCAGGLAKAYEQRGGKVVYFGKPYAPVYADALKAAGNPSRPLVVGDALATDIKGANLMGLDVLFVMDGIHAADVTDRTPQGVARFLASEGLTASAAIAFLAW